MTLLLSPYQKIVAVMVLANFALTSCSKKDESSQAPLQTEQAAPPPCGDDCTSHSSESGKLPCRFGADAKRTGLAAR